MNLVALLTRVSMANPLCQNGLAVDASERTYAQR